MNKAYEINGAVIEVDDELHDLLNLLARRLYADIGYVIASEGKYNFAGSTHPQERKMYQLALTAYEFNLTIGLE